MQPPIHEIDAHDPLLVNTLATCFNRSEPLIIRGLYAGSKPCRQWDIAYFRRVLDQERVIPVTAYERKSSGYDTLHSRHDYQLPFGEAASLFESEGPGTGKIYNMYMGSIPATFPELVPDADLPACLAGYAEPQWGGLWLGNGGNLSVLHHDQLNNFFLQVAGTKQFTIFDAADYYLLYADPATNFSNVFLENPDPVAFPLFRYARSHTFRLGPGDFLYLPPFWWHQVEALDKYISINFWGKVLVEQWLCAPAFPLFVGLYRKNRLLATLSDLKDNHRTHAQLAEYVLFKGYHWAAALIVLSMLTEKLNRLAAGSGDLAAGDDAWGVEAAVSRVEKRHLLDPETVAHLRQWVLLEKKALERDNSVSAGQVNGLLHEVNTPFPHAAAEAGNRQ